MYYQTRSVRGELGFSVKSCSLAAINVNLQVALGSTAAWPSDCGSDESSLTGARSSAFIHVVLVADLAPD